MRTSTRQPNARRTHRRRAHAPRRVAGRPTAEQRVRAEGGPQDIAFYRCDCGCGFDDAVSTQVACPHCGTEQAW